MEAPNSKWYTPFKRGRFIFYRFPSKFMTGDCSIEIINGMAIIKSGGAIRLIEESSGRYVYFKLAVGVLPSTKYRADVYSDRIELIWE